jgi:tetratricopeptide (TPR) repeat protein
VTAGLWLARRRIGRGPLVAVLGFAGTLVPALGFFDVYPFRYSFVADHFQYLASVPLIALAAAGLARVLDGRPAAPAVVGAVLVALAALTARRTLAYEDEQALWEDTLTKHPDCAVAHARLGIILAGRGQYRPAADHFREVVRLTPDSGDDRLFYASLAARAGRTDEAEAAYRAVLAADPDSTAARLGLADTLARATRYAEAAAELEAVRARQPTDAHLHFLLGMVRARQGQMDRALHEVEEAHRLAPENGEYAQTLEGLRRANGKEP